MVPLNTVTNQWQSKLRVVRNATRMRPRRRAFILLMSLILIMLVGIVLAGLARHALLVTSEAQLARDELQQRWGRHFLQRALMLRPEKLIARHSEQPVERREMPLPIVETIVLGDVTLHVVLDDENRKLNVNRLRAATGSQAAEQTIRRFAGNTPVDLKPVRISALGIQELDSWGHVLKLDPGLSQRQQFEQFRMATESITCWGNAKVNVHQCSDEVLHSVASIAAGPITANKLVALRESEPGMPLQDLLTKLAVNRRKLAILRGWLSEDSRCYSLWIFAEGEPDSLDLFVREETGSEAYSVRHFQW